jgi:hypothetical protein
MIFILIAIPGFILSLGLAFLTDPARKGIINKEKQHEESFIDVIAYIRSKFSAYFTLMIAASFIVVPSIYIPGLGSNIYFSYSWLGFIKSWISFRNRNLNFWFFRRSDRASIREIFRKKKY